MYNTEYSMVDNKALPIILKSYFISNKIRIDRHKNEIVEKLSDQIFLKYSQSEIADLCEKIKLKSNSKEIHDFLCDFSEYRKLTENVINSENSKENKNLKINNKKLSQIDQIKDKTIASLVEELNDLRKNVNILDKYDNLTKE